MLSWTPAAAGTQCPGRQHTASSCMSSADNSTGATQTITPLHLECMALQLGCHMAVAYAAIPTPVRNAARAQHQHLLFVLEAALLLGCCYVWSCIYLLLLPRLLHSCSSISSSCRFALCHWNVQQQRHQQPGVCRVNLGLVGRLDLQ